MALVLEIDHLLGAAFAAKGVDSDEPDWPPQPDRVFSALVASWAARGGLADEREALEWLERQPAPSMAASGAHDRRAPTTFVPPNDSRTGRTVGDRTVLPALRRRQPRRFPAALPHDPLARLVWDAEPGAVILSALDALARDTSYVGHSASLTRCRFIIQAMPGKVEPARRRIHAGRLKALETAYQAGKRPTPGETIQTHHIKTTPPTASLFSPDWLTFQIVSGAVDVRLSPLLCKTLIKALMAGYERTGATPPPIVAGHEDDRSPASVPHLAAVPMSYAGYPHADGDLKGFALVPPRDKTEMLRDPVFIRALNALREGDDRLITLRIKNRTPELKLALTSDAPPASLRPGRYGGGSKLWATATPIVLDRHLKIDMKARGAGKALQNEIESQISAMCERIGLPRPAQVVADKHSAIQGAVSTHTRHGAPWATPDFCRSRPLTHATIRFDETVMGPLILGAGRFCGLGLCLPLRAGRRA